MILWELDRTHTQARALGLALAAGVLFCGYDLLPFFCPAALLIVAARRRWHLLPTVLAAMIAPVVAANALIHRIFDVAVLNSNNRVYLLIAGAYLHRPDWHAWARLLARLPEVTLANFFFSGFVFLPSLFVAVWAIARRRVALGAVERALLITSALLFLFNNLAPPYGGSWQMRGVWIARLYQPLFVPFLLYVARAVGCGNLPQRWWRAPLAATVLLNALVVFGPISHVGPLDRLSSFVYARFYRHGKDDTLTVNLDRFGRRPLGFCTQGKR
jgi:hypothetical protein